MTGFLQRFIGAIAAILIFLMPMSVYGAHLEEKPNAADYSIVKINQFYVIDGVGFEEYIYNEENIQQYADAVNIIANSMPEETDVYVLVTPTAGEFHIPAVFEGISANQYQGIKYAYDRFDGKVKKVNAYKNMEKYADAENLFFKTDHHWTALGAYRAYEAFAEVAGFDPVPLTEYEVKNGGSYVGSLYGFTNDSSLKANPDEFVYYYKEQPLTYEVYGNDNTTHIYDKIIFDNNAAGGGKYYTFMGGDFSYGRVDTELGNAPSIMVVKDSYGNAFLPFLAPHYSSIYVIDPRHFSGDIAGLAADLKIDQVLIIDYTMTLNMPLYAKMMKSLIPSSLHGDALEATDTRPAEPAFEVSFDGQKIEFERGEYPYINWETSEKMINLKGVYEALGMTEAAVSVPENQFATPEYIGLATQTIGATVNITEEGDVNIVLAGDEEEAQERGFFAKLLKGLLIVVVVIALLYVGFVLYVRNDKGRQKKAKRKARKNRKE